MIDVENKIIRFVEFMASPFELMLLLMRGDE